jgi:hypothetical protein
MRQFAKIVQLRAPIMSDVIGFMDGVSIPAECDLEYVRIQNLHGYNRIAQYYFRPGDYHSDNDNDDNDDASSEGGNDN